MVGDFDGRRHGFVAQPVEQSETRIDAPVVLRESYEIPASKVVICDSESPGRGIRITDEEIGEIVSGACDGRAIDEFTGEQSGEGELAAGIGIRVCVQLDSADFAAELHRVLFMHERHGIEKTKRLIPRERWDRIAETGETREIQAGIAKINRIAGCRPRFPLGGDIVDEGVVAQNLNAAAAVVYVRVVDETWLQFCVRPRSRF